MTRVSDALAFDLAAPGFVSDPYPTYAALREHDPVHESRFGYWVLTRHDDILQALRDPRLGNEPSRYSVLHRRNAERYISADVANDILPFLDQPAHGPYRRWVSRAFRAHWKAAPPDVRGIARRLLEKAEGRGAMDLVREFGKPLSRAVISRILGVPEEDEARLAAWSELFFYLFVPIPSSDVLAQMEAALGEFREYFLRLVEARRKRPENDLISRFAAGPVDGAPPSDKRIADACMLLFADGVENIDSAIANGIVALLENPEQLALLRREPARMGRAAEECLRFDPPVQFIGRIANEETTIRGKTIRKHQAVLLMLAAANRDPAVFALPDRFDLTRFDPAKQAPAALSFGRGRHLCIGAPLVMTELATGLACILEALPNLALAPEPPRWVPRAGHRWREELRVSFGRSA